MKGDKLFEEISWNTTYDGIYQVLGYDLGEAFRISQDPEIVDPDTYKVLFPKSVFDELDKICRVGVEPVLEKKHLEAVLFVGKKMGFNLITFEASLNDGRFWQWPYLDKQTGKLEQSPFYHPDNAYCNKPRTYVTFADRWRFVKDGWEATDQHYTYERFDGLAYFIQPYRGGRAGQFHGIRNTLHAGYFKALEKAVGIEVK